MAFGCLSSTSWENYALMLEKYPYLLQHKTYCGGDFYLFSKIRPAKISDEYFFSITNTFEPNLPEWNSVNEKKCTDSLVIEGKKSYVMDAGQEFSPTYSNSLRSLIHSENDAIDVSVDVRTPLVFPGAWLVLTVTSDGRDIKWSAMPVNDFVKPGNQGRVFHSLRLSDIELRHHRLVFTAYIWNPMKSPYIIDNFSVRVRTGNPIIYGLYRNIGR
jgi:hypothetical protein